MAIEKGTPAQFRAACNAAMEGLCTELTDAIQAAGITALGVCASDKEIERILAMNAEEKEEFHRIIAGSLMELGKTCLTQYVAAANRALRFDEMENDNDAA